MALFSLKTNFSPCGDQPTAITTLTQALQAKEPHITLLGATGTGKTFTMAQVIAQLERPTMIMAPNKTLAAQLYGEMRTFFPENAVEYFVSYYDYYQPEAYVPSSDTYIEKDSAINEQIEQLRLSATRSLLERRDCIIVATVSAIYGLGDPSAYLSMTLSLKQGEVFNPKVILQKLVAMQYKRNDMVLERGNFRVRGEVIDVFPADSGLAAIRIAFFDDVIEQLAHLDPLTGEILGRCAQVTIFPKSHYVAPREQVVNAMESIKAELKERLAFLEAEHKLLEYQRLKERTQYDLEMMQEVGYCSGIENYSRHLTGHAPGEPPPTLFDYLPEDALLFLDESHVLVPQLGAMYKGDRARKENLVNYGFRLPSALDNRPLTFEEFESRAPQTVYVSATPGDYEYDHSKTVTDQVVRPTGILDPIIVVRPVASQVQDLLSEANIRAARKERVLVTTLTKKMSEDLCDYLNTHGVKTRYLHSEIDTVERMEILRDLRLGAFDVLVGINLLREGLDLPEVSLVAILDADKEGFLRSTRSLVQTIGRAARHIDGTAILYADKVTKSMREAMDETSRRRSKQEAYNALHQITPMRIEKAVQDVLDLGAPVPKKGKGKGKAAPAVMVSEFHSEKDLIAEIKRLKTKLAAHVSALEFEKACEVRDILKVLEQRLLMPPV